jgi:hypothetical protein
MPPDDPLAKLIDRAAVSDAPPEVRAWFHRLAAGDSQRASSSPPPTSAGDTASLAPDADSSEINTGRRKRKNPVRRQPARG